MFFNEFCYFIENYEGGAVTDTSAKFGQSGTELPGGNADIEKGYGNLVEKLAQGVDVELRSKVVRVSYGESGVNVTVEKDGQDLVYSRGSLIFFILSSK